VSDSDENEDKGGARKTDSLLEQTEKH